MSHHVDLTVDKEETEGAGYDTEEPLSDADSGCDDTIPPDLVRANDRTKVIGDDDNDSDSDSSEETDSNSDSDSEIESHCDLDFVVEDLLRNTSHAGATAATSRSAPSHTPRPKVGYICYI